MKTPRQIKNLECIDSCVGISSAQWDEYMEGTTKANGRMIRNHIKKHLPELYDSIDLDFFNPFEYQSRKKEGLFVYVHSMIEYFLRYE